jgi:pullulanase
MCFLYQNKNGPFGEVILLVNPTESVKSVIIPKGKWYKIASHEMVEVSTNFPLNGGEVVIEPISLNLLAKK